MDFLHNHKRFKDVVSMVSQRLQIDSNLIEKDYWIMHCLWGLQNLGLLFYLKGGTSLSKGFKAINRFSEDLDIMIVPPESMTVKTGKSHIKDIYIQSRIDFFNWLITNIKISGIASVDYDLHSSVDPKHRSADLVLKYNSINDVKNTKLKPGILLEVGFDQVEPFTPKLYQAGHMILPERLVLI